MTEIVKPTVTAHGDSHLVLSPLATGSYVVEPELTVEKITYVCRTCNAELRRKPTEPEPRSCNYCHTPGFTYFIK